MENEYQIRKDERSATLRALATKLSALLGWPAVESSEDAWWCAKLQCPTAGTVYLQADWNKRTLRVSGGWPTNARGESFTPQRWQNIEAKEISASLDRAPEAIAKDILRRFLPSYQTAWDVLAQRVRESNKFHDDKRDVATQLAAAAGAQIGEQHRDAYYLSGSHCTVEVNSAESFKINHNGLTVGQAIKLIHFLNTL